MTKYNVKKTMIFAASILSFPLLVYWFIYDLQLMFPAVGKFFDGVAVLSSLYGVKGAQIAQAVTFVVLGAAFFVFIFAYKKEGALRASTLLFLSEALVSDASLLIKKSYSAGFTAREWFTVILMFLFILFITMLELSRVMSTYPKDESNS